MPLDEPIRSRDFVGYNPFVVGRGRTVATDSLSHAGILQQAQIPIHENAVCMKEFKKIGLFVSPLQFDSSAICAGNMDDGKSGSNVDSGGKL